MSNEDENYDLLKRKLRKVFKLEHFRSTAQKDAVKTILLRKQDVAISFPPGQGKSLCFQLPGLMHENKLTVVFSLSSTMIKDQIYCLQKSKICAKAITTTTSVTDIEQVLSDLNSDEPETKFLYVNPEQANTEAFDNVLQRLQTNDKLAYIAVYDAHAIEYSKLGSLRAKYPSVPWITLTPKISTEVRNYIVNNFQLHKPIATFQKSSFRKNIHYDVVLKNKITEHFVDLQQYVTKSLGVPDDKVKQSKKPCGIIYCRNRDSVELVTKELNQQGVSTKAYHSGLRSRDRTKVLEDWIAGVFPVIIVTSSFSGGIDKSSVRFVVHWDVPQSVGSYYKESGRAGRDGRSSYCRIYYCEETVIKIYSSLSDPNKSKELIDFVKVRHYCESNECRHKTLAIYFDDGPPECEDRCDVCKSAIHLDDNQREIPISTSNSNSHPVRIKEEPHSPEHAHPTEITANGQLIKLEREDTVTHEDRTHGNVSPARTIIKEEIVREETDSGMQVFSNWSNVLFTRPPGNVSPARTIIKEEIPAETDYETGLRNIKHRPPSPAETVLEEDPSPNIFVKVKREVVSPSRPIDVNIPISFETNIKREPISPREYNRQIIITESKSIDKTNPVAAPSDMIQPISDPVSLPDLNNLELSLPHSSRLVDQNNLYDMIPLNSLNGTRNSSDPIPSNGITAQQNDPYLIPEATAINKEPATHLDQVYSRLNPSPTNTIIKDEQRSPAEFVENESNNSQPSRLSSPIERSSKHKPRKRSRSKSTERRIYKEPVTHLEQVYRRFIPSPTNTIIKDERRSPEEFLENGSNNAQSIRSRRSSERRMDKEPTTQLEQAHTRLTPSPTNTIIKDERRSPEGFSGNGSNNPECSRSSSPKQSIIVNTYERNSKHKSTERSRSRSSERRIYNESTTQLEHAYTRLTPSPTNTIIKDERRSPVQSSTNARNSKHKQRKRSRSRSSERRIYKRESDEEYGNTTTSSGRDRVTDRFNANNSYSTRMYSPQRHSDNYSGERRSNYKREHDNRKRESEYKRRNEPSQSSSRKKTHRRDSPKFSESRKESRKRRRSYESDSSYENKQIYSRDKSGKKNQMNRGRNEREKDSYSTISSDECRSPQPSTSAGPRKHSVKNWSDIRLPVSPSHDTQQKEDSDTDYGWEDPAPPKPKPEVSSTSAFEDMDPEYKEKMNILNNEIKNEFDLDVITAKKNELLRVIELSIEAQSKKKLDDLGKEIQKRKDDHIKKLFGTDNFDSWDDDAALSNVKMASKLKPLKPVVSDDVPLLEKMNMKHVIIQMHANRLTQSHRRNELVFQGQIKKIETKFQGQLTPSLTEAIKKEKSIIADLVVKYLMPYYMERKIQPKELFPRVARNISHIFYDRFADEVIIRDYIDDLFQKVGIVTPSTNIM